MDQASGLDDIHQQDVAEDGNLDVTPWFQDAPHGRGAPMLNGRGTINFVQNAANNDDTAVGFSLVTEADITTFCSVSGGAGSLCTGSGSGGLIMNNLAGDTPTAVDSASTGTLNILEMDDEDLNEWHEFWITMENNGATPGNIQVKVYMDGDVSNPSTFQVTLAGPGNAVYTNENDPFLEMGFSFNAEWGSIDIDFLSYAFGVIAPVAAGLLGDFNDDGKVDAADYVVWQKNDSANNPLPNDDGLTNQADRYNLWQMHFGEMEMMGSGGESGTVPEPSSIVLIALASIAIGLVGRRHKRSVA
jgi:hypothetical protein